jgi:hypothetical protein
MACKFLIMHRIRCTDHADSEPRPLLDKNGRIIAVLAGQPRHEAYRAAVEDAFLTIRNASTEARFPASMRRHRRGLFAAINVGISYGKGQATPCWLNNKEYNGLADSLLANSSIARIAGFADGKYIPVPSIPLPRLRSSQLPSPCGPHDFTNTIGSTTPSCAANSPTCAAHLQAQSFLAQPSILARMSGRSSTATS